MPPAPHYPPRHARTYEDIEVGTIWYRADHRADVCIIRQYNPADDPDRVRVQYLNNRRVYRTLTMGVFREQWVHRPRIDLVWFDIGSIWRRIHRVGRYGQLPPEDRQLYSILRAHNGRVTMGHAGSHTILEAALNFVRIWPTGVTFPETPETPAKLVLSKPPRKRPKTPRKRKVVPTMWDRLDKDLFDDPPT